MVLFVFLRHGVNVGVNQPVHVPHGMCRLPAPAAKQESAGDAPRGQEHDGGRLGDGNHVERHQAHRGDIVGAGQLPLGDREALTRWIDDVEHGHVGRAVPSQERRAVGPAVGRVPAEVHERSGGARQAVEECRIRAGPQGWK